MAEEKIYCVTYRRVSSEKQKERGLSLDAQKSLLFNWAGNKYAIVKDFEAGESAKASGRVEFKHMIKYCLDNDIKDILVEKTDRLQRSKEDEVWLEKLMRDHDLKIHLVKENRVMSKDGSATDQLIDDMQGLFARHEIRVLKERVIKGLKEKLKRNEYPCSAPTGYKNVSKSKENPVAQIVPDEVMFPRVKKFFETHLTGKHSIDDMKRIAKNLGVKSIMGNNLTDGGVRHLLHSKFYYGEFDYSFENEEPKTYKNETPGFVSMITKRQWQKNQDILKSRLNRVDTRNGVKEWKFKEMVRCQFCGRFLLGERAVVKYKTNSGMKKFERNYYHCSGGTFYVDSKNNRVDKERVKKDDFGTPYFETDKGLRIEIEKRRCTVQGIREDELEKELLWEFGTLQFNKSVWKKMKTAIFKNPQRDQVHVELHGLRAEHSKNGTKLETMYNDKIEGVITESFWRTQHERISQRQIEIEERIDELESMKKFYDTKVKTAVDALDALENFGEKFKNADPKTRKSMVQLMVRNIFLTGGGKDSEGHKIPFDLYVEWNEDFAELYDLGLVALSKETEKKYKLSGGISNSKNRLSLVKKVRNIINLIVRLAESPHLESLIPETA